MNFKQFIPPVLYAKLVLLLRKGLMWEGNYNNWEEALANSTGYDQKYILQKTAKSVQKVLNGEAQFERDSIAFQHKEYNNFVLSHLLSFKLLNQETLSVCDFGGSLGSTFLQHREILDLLDVEWSIIEQEHYIDYAKANIAIDNLHFYKNLEAFSMEQKANVLLLSSVLSYLKDPFNALDEMLALNFQYIIIDKTPIHPGNSSRLTVQHVPKDIYKASYPCWFLSEEKLMEKMSNYELVDETVDKLECNLGFPMKGFAFKLKQ